MKVVIFDPFLGLYYDSVTLEVTFDHKDSPFYYLLPLEKYLAIKSPLFIIVALFANVNL